jgi:hypothetical protein
MPVQQYTASLEGHEIRVENTWFAGSKLYIDNHLLDISHQFLAGGKTPVLRGRLSKSDDAPWVNVLCRSNMFDIDVQIQVDEKTVPAIEKSNFF